MSDAKVPGPEGGLGELRSLWADLNYMGCRYVIVLFGIYAGFPSLLLSWWETGHQTVARIAAAHLTPAARTRVARILNVPDTAEAVADGLATASTWADEIKTDTKTGSWHYINLTLQDDKSDIPSRCENDNCAPVRIRLFAAQLASQSADARWS